MRACCKQSVFTSAVLVGMLSSAAFCEVALSPGAVRAEESAGQALLDQAIDAKVAAESMTDLGEVVRLCQDALAKGLDAPNADFAKKLMAGTLLQRAQIICSEIFDNPTPSPRWPVVRSLAVADLEQSLEANPDQAEAQFLLGRLESLPGGDSEKAVKAINLAVTLSDKQPSLKVKALLQRVTLTKSPAARRADLDEALKLAPANADVLRTEGMFLLTQNDPEAALRVFDKAIAASESEPEAYEGRGMALFMLKRYDDAMKSFDKVIELAPSSPVVYTHRARIKAIKGQFIEAISEINNALQLSPNFEAALLLRSRVYQQMGLSDKALADVNHVLDRDPDNSQAQQIRAVLLAGSGKLNEAIDDLEGLLKKEPEDSELLLQLALFYAADRKPQKAIDAYGAFLKQQPNNWVAYRGRGDAYLSLSKQPEALADYEAALKLDAENSGVLNNLAWLLATSPSEKLRNGSRAIELATQACKLTDYKQAHILSTLAAAYAETGDFKTAIKWSTEAVNVGEESIKGQLRQELASYEGGKPWREATPPSVVHADDASAGAKPEDANSDDAPAESRPDATSNLPRTKR